MMVKNPDQSEVNHVGKDDDEHVFFFMGDEGDTG